MSEYGGGVGHWWIVLACAIALLVLVTVGIVVVNVTAEQFNTFAVGPFIVADKQVSDVTRNYGLFEVKIGTVYLLYDCDGRYASVCQATFDYYMVGDLYPNTEGHIMIG